MVEKDVFQSFREVVDNRHQYAKDWKEKNKSKVIGWICTYTPVELIYAAGMLPARALGSHENDRICDEYLIGEPCAFCVDCLNQALRGRYDYLSGIVNPRCCDYSEFIFHNWTKGSPVDLHYMIYMPGNINSPRALPLLVAEYKDFIEALEKLSGKTISQEDLDRAIQLYNENRRLMKQVYEFRKMANPPLTGFEAMEMVIASQLMDVAEHNKLLEQLLEELPERKLERDIGSRLMLVGSEYDDIEFTRAVEEMGCTFVIEESCCGTRYFWNEIEPQDDHITAIASRYINRWPCPAMDWQDTKRDDIVWNLAQEYKVEGVILYYQKFCSPHEYDIPRLDKMFKERGIPTYTLEFDVTQPIGQFRTRIEAFLETLMLELI